MLITFPKMAIEVYAGNQSKFIEWPLCSCHLFKLALTNIICVDNLKIYFIFEMLIKFFTFKSNIQTQQFLK